MKRVVLAAALAAVQSFALAGAPVGWRDNGTSNYPAATVPMSWSETQNVIWKTPTAKWSNSTPLVMADRVVFCEEPDAVVCVSLADGKVLWRASAGVKDVQGIPAGVQAKAHPTNGYTSPTPVTNGSRIATLNGFGIAACFDVDGKRLWARYLDTPKHGWGTSASPVMAGNIVAFQINDTLYGLDLATGKQSWKTPSVARWGSPLAVQIGGKDVLVMPNGDFIDAATGAKLATGVADLKYNAPLLSDGVLYYMCGENGCKAVRVPETLDAANKPQVLWQSKITKAERTYASPVIADGIIYVITRYNTLAALDVADGKLLWEQAIKFAPQSQAYPSLIVVGRNLLVSADSGETLVLEPGREYKELRRNTLEPFRSTPVVRDGRMYVRGLKSMVCVGQ